MTYSGKISLAIASLATLCLAAHPAAAQTITIANNSFESFTGTNANGYNTITSWSQGVNTGANTAAQPFADNGKIPNGIEAAFLQTNAALGGAGNVPQTYIAQTLSGFTVGQQYILTFFDNARAAGAPLNAVSVNVFFGGTVFQAVVAGQYLVTDTGTNIYTNPALTNVAPSGNTTTPYNMVSVAFTPGVSSGTLAFVGSGNGALLLDNVSIAAAPEPSQYAAFGIGLLGLGALAMKARKRSRLSA